MVGSVRWYPVNMTGYGEGWASGQYLTNVISAAAEPSETAVASETVLAIEPTVTEEPPATATDVIVPPTEVPTEVPTVAPSETPVPPEEEPVEENAPAEGTP
jgi:hypothetical protein